ncbi:MAG: hypothetical protein JW888_15805, partial [Pirellulales bacterium]|nr:hypothetical protein [Pirellulales bacterium]
LGTVKLDKAGLCVYIILPLALAISGSAIRIRHVLAAAFQLTHKLNTPLFTLVCSARHIMRFAQSWSKKVL